MKKKPIAAVSLKMYFTLEETREYCRALAEGAQTNPVLSGEHVRAAVFPSFISVPEAMEILAETPVMVGVQNVCEIEQGARTGEVSVRDVKDIGCQIVELGHAERITLYGETTQVTAAKTQLTLDNGLIPLICIGEPERLPPEETAVLCASQALEITNGGTDQEVWLGYEPYWAIGAAEPAPAEYVVEVCTLLRGKLMNALPKVEILYGGSAGPGLAERLGGAIDGLFLGRFAHDPRNYFRVAEELADFR